MNFSILNKLSHLGLHVRKKRLDSYMNQRDASKAIGVSEDCITLWENNKAKPQIQHMRKVIEFLGYNPIEVEAKILAGQIKNYHIKNGLGHKKMGLLIGVDASTIGAWESAKSHPTGPNRKALDKILKQ